MTAPSLVHMPASSSGETSGSSPSGERLPCQALGGAKRGGQVPARRPAGAAAMGAAARVTPRGGDTWEMRACATVRDTDRDDGRCGAAADAGGDVGGREQVAVAGVPTARAVHDPPNGLGNAFGASRAGRGGPPLIDQDEGDSSYLGLVRDGLDQVPDSPVSGPLVVPPPRVQVQYAAGVADRQGANLVLDSPDDDRFCRLVLRLPHPSAVAGLGGPLAAPVVPPAARAFLPRPGRAAGHRRRRPLASARCWRCSARIARADTSSASPSGPATA
jgi:hypothetical protein